MTECAGTMGPRIVAVGETREHASEVFGYEHDDLLVTTYDDLALEVDLQATTAVELASGTAWEAALELLLTHVQDGAATRLRVEAEPSGARVLRERLERHPTIGVADLTHRDTRTVLALERMEPAEARRSHVALTALDLLELRGPVTGTPREPIVAQAADQPPSAVARVPSRPRPTAAVTAHRMNAPRSATPHPPRPIFLRLMNRYLTITRAETQRRRAAAMLGAAVLAALGGSALLWLIGGIAGSGGVLGTLHVVSLIATVLLILLVVLTQRDLHQHRSDFRQLSETTEQRLNRQRATLIERTEPIAGHQRSLRKTQSELAALTRHIEAIDATQSASRAQLSEWLKDLDERGPRLHLETQRQVQAHLNLQRLLTMDGRVPPLGGWAVSADLMVLVLDETRSLRPRTIVECGSGISTLLLAMAAREHGLHSRIVALEHLPEHQRATQDLLVRHGLADRAEVRLAPLEHISRIDHDTPWYAESALADLNDIGLLLVDGPPAVVGQHVRYPAIPLLGEKLATDCVVIMDDLIRESEHDIAEMWRELLPDFDYHVFDGLQKQAGVFRRRG